MGAFDFAKIDLRLPSLTFRWLLFGFMFLFLCLFSCEGSWNGSVLATPDCDPSMKLKGTAFWKSTFGKSGYERVRGCLRIAWGVGEKEGKSMLVEVTKKGLVFGKNKASGLFDGNVSLELPPESRGKPHLFNLFVFGETTQSEQQQKALCTTKMSSPHFRCEQAQVSDCFFSWAFRPASNGSFVSAPIPGDEKASCRLFWRHSLLEPNPEPDSEPNPEPSGDKHSDILIGESLLEVLQDASREAPSESNTNRDSREASSLEVTPDTHGQDNPTKETKPDGSFGSMRAMKWCGNGANGASLDNAFFVKCDAQTSICLLGMCQPFCQLVPPVSCPTTKTYNCGLVGNKGLCFTQCSSKNDFGSNYDPICPVGYMCEGDFVNANIFRAIGHCAPSTRYAGYATGTKVLGATCTKKDGCDGTKGFFCLIQDGKTKGICDRACDPRPNSKHGCPTGDKCIPEDLSFLQGRCGK